jgi:hypothetical protein
VPGGCGIPLSIKSMILVHNPRQLLAPKLRVDFELQTCVREKLIRISAGETSDFFRVRKKDVGSLRAVL